MKRLFIIFLGTLAVAISACSSSDYACPLHDKSGACLSELTAYQQSNTKKPIRLKQMITRAPYIATPVKPHQKKTAWLSWRGPLNTEES